MVLYYLGAKGDAGVRAAVTRLTGPLRLRRCYSSVAHSSAVLYRSC